MPITLPSCSVHFECCKHCHECYNTLRLRWETCFLDIHHPATDHALLCRSEVAFQLQRSASACISSPDWFIIYKYWLRSKASSLLHPLKSTHTRASFVHAFNFTVFIIRNETPCVGLWCCQMWIHIGAFPKPREWVSWKAHTPACLACVLECLLMN